LPLSMAAAWVCALSLTVDHNRSFKKGLEQMGDMVGEVREQLNASLESLGWKVEAGLRHQRLMGEDVRRARDHVQHLEALVLSMEGRLHDSIVRDSLLGSPRPGFARSCGVSAKNSA
jgi:hypothetical protein